MLWGRGVEIGHERPDDEKVPPHTMSQGRRRAPAGTDYATGYGRLQHLAARFGGRLDRTGSRTRRVVLYPYRIGRDAYSPS